MKAKFALFFIFFSSILSSQTLSNKTVACKKIFLDSLWIETEEGKHTYYRIIEDYNVQKPLHTVLDYYKNDTLQMKAFTSSLDKIVKEGSAIFYYQNGKKKQTANYEGNKATGKECTWYENGNKQSEGEFISSSDKGEPPAFILNQYWKEDGKQIIVDGNGRYEKTDENFSEEGNMVDGRRNGDWKGEWKFEKGKAKFTFVENYDRNGELIKGTSTDSLGAKHPYTKVRINPQPRKGMSHFYGYIGKKFRFTKETEGQTGKIVLLFYIEPNGDASEISVLRSAGKAFDEEGIRLVSNYPEWESGSYRGVKYRFSFTLPITIKTP